MFVRKKKNRSGTTSVVVVDKSFGKFVELKTISIATTETDIKDLVTQGKDWIAHFDGQQTIDFECKEAFKKAKEVTTADQVFQISLKRP